MSDAEHACGSGDPRVHLAETRAAMTRLGMGLLHLLGWAVVIGGVVAMAIWPTNVTILLFVVVLLYPSWEKHVESRINRFLAARRDRAAASRSAEQHRED